MRTGFYTALMKEVHRLLLVCLSFLVLNGSFSQSSNISGVVNSYYKVIEVIPAKACVRLTSVAGLARLQKVLLVQIKGASVSTTDNSSFGDTTALNNAGNYEVAIICAINGDSVFMFHNLLNSYTVADKVQLVKFAEYYSATVTDTLKAAPWDNTAGVGGVIALSVSTDLVLNAPIYADASGFWGGSYVLSSGTCFNFPASANGYIYDASATSPQNGAYKGESVYAITVAGQTGGRGAPANGGGGGNNHNNGGGGGANLAAGGRGGGNSSSAGCTTTLRGEAGKALSSWGGKKIFFGGGGGAGHSNGTLTVSNGGGHGGGIIFIRANNLTGNGYKISANGDIGGDAVSDGASGGGGGGTIIMDVTGYSGLLTIESKGGNGGLADDAGTTNRCYGAGGGGGGGVIYFTGSVPAATISTSGGAAGSEISRDAGCNAAVLPLNGSNGATVSSYSVRQATDSASYCLSIGPLQLGLVYFRASATRSAIDLQWMISNPSLIKTFIIEKWAAGVWNSLQTVAANSSQLIYEYSDGLPSSGNNLYRLRMIGNDNSFSFSQVRTVNWINPGERFTVYPNPARDRFTVSGELEPMVTIKLSTLTGKLCMERTLVTNSKTLQVELPDLAPGTYLLYVNDVIRKLVIKK